MRAHRKVWTDTHPCRALRDCLRGLDQGFSYALGVLLIAIVSVLITSMGLAVSVAQLQVRTQLLADTAALTAADTLIGAIAGYPCENADNIVALDGAFMASCRIVGLGAQIEVTQNLGFLEVSGWAEAGADALQ